ncbi:hypothetical protein BGX29_010387 [Mortierella sp. GBA35]|nr:hypothetical protein BGX29_010387 [Mortierella sp. GBA35]
MQGDSSQEHVQAVRAVNKDYRPTTGTPADPDDIFYIDCHVDPATKKEFILWDDILQVFEGAQQVRHKARMLPFLKDADFRILEPRRIATIPNAVLDVVIGDQLPTTNVVSPENALQEVSLDASPKESISTRRNPVYGEVERALENLNHIDNPATAPFRRAPQTLPDDQSTDSNNYPEPQYSGNKAESRAPQSYPVAESRDITQTMISAGLGDKDAQVALGDMYRDGEVVQKDYQAAMDWYLKAADQGDPVGLRKVGVLYYHGQGVPQDYSAAMEWYLKAADQGNADAQFNIGTLYSEGHGVPQDYLQAMTWYLKAADQGYADARCIIGTLYSEGHGVPQDYWQAMTWFLKAADQGDANAQYNIGVMYKKGLGVPQDYSQAMVWYRKAADQGDGDAQLNIGVLYEQGRGVPQDWSKAMEWFRKASDQGYQDAAIYIEALAQKVSNSGQGQGQSIVSKAEQLGPNGEQEKEKKKKQGLFKRLFK